jgi:type IV pilus assembly protein PilB
VGRKSRAASARSLQRPNGHRCAGLRAHQKELFLKRHPQTARHGAGHRPHRQRQNRVAVHALNILNTPEVNISTAEDPVEINLEGINQVNVNPKVGMTFANALRAFLRQDPDIIMVGEIRDLETAEIAIKAAQTGHMVLVHPAHQQRPQTLTRLMNMGVAPYNIASSVTLIIAQRLARRLCPHCKEKVKIPTEELINQGFREDELKDLTIFKAGRLRPVQPRLQGPGGHLRGDADFRGNRPDHHGRRQRFRSPTRPAKEGINDLRQSG